MEEGAGTEHTAPAWGQRRENRELGKLHRLDCERPRVEGTIELIPSTYWKADFNFWKKSGETVNIEESTTDVCMCYAFT